MPIQDSHHITAEVDTSAPPIECMDDNRSGILNPLESDCPREQNGRISLSDHSTVHMTMPTSEDAVSISPREVSIPDGWTRSSQRSRVRGRVNRFWGMQDNWKDLSSSHGQWACFLCFHVRTATILIGFWHVVLHIMTLILMAVIMIHPEILKQVNKENFEGEKLDVSNEGVQDVQAVNCSEMPCLLATQRDGRLRDATPDFPISLGILLSTHQLNTEDENVDLFITLCTFVVTLLLVYGAFREQPSHLMPFFFLQVFDFCIFNMTMFGYLSYLPNVRQVIKESPIFPLQHFPLAMNTKCLTFFVLLVLIITFLVKAYFISIVWRCYKYLMQRSQGVRWHPRSRLGHSGPVDQESQTLVMGHDLPDYNTAITDPQYRKTVSGLFPEPPPSYDMAMAAYVAQQEILSEAQNRSAPAGPATTDNAPLVGSTTTTAEVNEISASPVSEEAGPSSRPRPN